MDIIHPETGETINLFSQEGLDILNNFINTYKKGGNLDDKINNLTNIYNNLQTQFNDIKNYFQKQTGGSSDELKRSYSVMSSSGSSPISDSGSDIEFIDKPGITERAHTEHEQVLAHTFIESLPDDIKDEIYSTWKGEPLRIHRKDDGQINLVETGEHFYKFIPVGDKANEIDKIYKTLGNYTALQGFTNDFYIPIIKLPIGTETIVGVEDKEYYVYKVEKWGESLEKIKNKGEIEIVGSGIFGQVMDWLKDTLSELHSKTIMFDDGEEKRLTHGDILNESGVNWGNILAKKYGDTWKFKLIDFGNEMSTPEKEKDLYDKFFLTSPVDSTIPNKKKILENEINQEEKRKSNKYKRRRIRAKVRSLGEIPYDSDPYSDDDELRSYFTPPSPLGSKSSVVKKQLFGTPSPSPSPSRYFDSPPPLSSSLTS